MPLQQVAASPAQDPRPDAGETLVLLDVAGQPVTIWKTGELRLDQAYDALRRPATKTVTIGSDPATIREIIEYGEAVTSAALSNLRGRPFQQWDTAGRVSFDGYDFKGNLLASTRHFWDCTGGDTVTCASTPDAGDLESSGYTTVHIAALHKGSDAMLRYRALVEMTKQ